MSVELPYISIVVPCFNAQRYIAQTLKSIVSQNYPRLELIVMDGGSTDGTVDIIKSFSSHIAYFYTGPDKGQADAILRGFEKANGEYVGWCNADDTYYPGSLLAAGKACASGADVLFGDKDYTDADGNFLFRAQAHAPTIKNLFPFPHIYSEAFLVRRSIIQEEKLTLNPDRHHLMDLDWFVRLFLEGKRFAKVEEFRATFRQHPDAKSSKQADVCHRESFEIALQTYPHHSLSPSDKAHLIHSMRLMAFNFWGAGEFGHLRETLCRASKIVGKQIFTPKLRLVWLLSRLGRRFIFGVKNIFGKLMRWATWRWQRSIAPLRYRNPLDRLGALPATVDQPLRLVILTRYPQTFDNAVWSAYSLLKHLDKRFHLTLVFNSPLPPADVQVALRSLFPQLTLMREVDCLNALGGRSKALETLAHQHAMGYKLATIFYFNAAFGERAGEKILFSDDDILAFNRLDEIIKWADDSSSATPLFLQESSTTTRHEPTFEAVAKRMGLKAHPLINVGLMALPAGYLSLEKLDELLSAVAKEQTGSLTWFPDTSALAFQLALGKGLPVDDYVCSVAGQFWGMRDVDYTSIKLRHFVGPIRHLMRLRGVPQFLKAQ